MTNSFTTTVKGLPKQLTKMGSEGTIQRHMCATIPLKEQLEVTRRFVDRKVIGKIIVTMDDTLSS